MKSSSSVRRPVCLTVYDIDFYGLAYYFFCDFCMNLGLNKHKEVAGPFLRKKNYYAQNGGNGTFLGPKLPFFKIYLSVFIRFISNCT